MLEDALHIVLAAYPTIHAACRRRHLPVRGRNRLSVHLTNVLEQLDPHEPRAVGDLARRMRVTPATISLQLARLARLRLVQRSRDERDGRRVLLRITDAGVRLRQQRSLLDPDRVRAALARLPSPEQEAVAAGVRLLARAAQSLPPDPSPGVAPEGELHR